jgi:hypothetical protein
MDSLRKRVFQTFSSLTGRTLDSPRAIRAALAEALKARDRLMASGDPHDSEAPPKEAAHDTPG